VDGVTVQYRDGEGISAAAGRVIGFDVRRERRLAVNQFSVWSTSTAPAGCGAMRQWLPLAVLG
jgi:hypothetical protein